MDTITQMTLGGAVGEAVLGRKVGNKAVLWGAVAGAIPDLDVLAGPFMNAVDRVAFHRGMTHSLLFALIFAPLLGYLIYSLYKKENAGWWDWSQLAFWAVVTHPLLDNFTSYGTQFFWPFSDYRIAFSSISVIDPVYSVPFLISVIVVLFYHRASPKRKFINYLGIGISSAYLLLTVVNKDHVTGVFEKNLRQQQTQFTRIWTSPTPLNNLLWRGVAETSDGFLEGYFSLLDDDSSVRFTFVPANRELLENLTYLPQIRKLIWITRGLYTVEFRNSALYINDMRYGRWNGWGSPDGEYVFSYRIQRFGYGTGMHFDLIRERPALQISGSTLKLFGLRLLGQTALNSY